MEVLKINPNSQCTLDSSFKYVRVAAVSMDLLSAKFNPLNFIVDQSYLWLHIKNQSYFVCKLDTRAGKNAKQINLLLSNSQDSQISFQNKGRFKISILLEVLQREGLPKTGRIKPESIQQNSNKSPADHVAELKYDKHSIQDFPLWEKITTSSEEGRRWYEDEEEMQDQEEGNIFSLLGKKGMRKKFSILK